MYKAIVFAGTTEGYALCEFLAENKVSVYACAATEYGGSLLKENEFLHVSAGRLKTEDMEELFRKETPEIVLDATHPYAAEVTKNIRTACENTDLPEKPDYKKIQEFVISGFFVRREKKVKRQFMWKVRKKRQSFFAAQKEISFLPREVRNWPNLQ